MSKRKGGEFWRSHVWLRRRALIRDRAPWASLLLALVFTAVAPVLPLGAMPVESLADMGLLYAALSFAAAIAGVGIAFGVPGSDRIHRWSQLSAPDSPFPAFSNLAFVFTWAAMVQVGVVVVAFLAIAFGRGYTVAPVGLNPFEAPLHYSALLVALWLWWYALFELTAVIRTVMQVTNAIVIEETRTPPPQQSPVVDLDTNSKCRWKRHRKRRD